MPLRTALSKCRGLIAHLISSQAATDAFPGTDREQELDSDRVFLEAKAIHEELMVRADDIETRLIDVRRDVLLTLIARAHQRDGGGA